MRGLCVGVVSQSVCGDRFTLFRGPRPGRSQLSWLASQIDSLCWTLNSASQRQLDSWYLVLIHSLWRILEQPKRRYPEIERASERAGALCHCVLFLQASCCLLSCWQQLAGGIADADVVHELLR